jgi:hypothetical protein
MSEDWVCHLIDSLVPTTVLWLGAISLDSSRDHAYGGLCDHV